MKIILSAFNGKMMSEPMDIPEGIGYVFKMVMTQPIQAYKDNLQEFALMDKPLDTVCIFEFNGKVSVYGKENVICREYVLTKIN